MNDEYSGKGEEDLLGWQDALHSIARTHTNTHTRH